MIISEQDKNQLYQVIKSTPSFNRLGPIANPSGVKDPFMVEIAPLISDPQKARVIGEIFGKIASQLDIDLLVGIATSAISLVTATSMMSGIPFVYIRKEKDPKTGHIIEGEFKKGAKALLIDDMIGDGSEKERVIKEIGDDLVIKDLLVLWESHESSYFNWPKRATDIGLNVISCFNWSELIAMLCRDNVLSKEASEIFNDWLYNIGKWSDNSTYLDKFENYKQKYRLQKGDSLI